jgi:hypothetical protein
MKIIRPGHVARALLPAAPGLLPALARVVPGIFGAGLWPAPLFQTLTDN